MVKVKEIYKQNVYGVITTLIFHIIILIVLLSTNLQNGKPAQEDTILLDFAVAEIKLPAPEKEVEQNSSVSQQTPGSNEQLSNRAVNDASTDESKSSSRSKASDPGSLRLVFLT